MLCDACGEKEATVHMTQMMDADVKKVHLCENCAAESGLDVNSPMSLTDVLLGFGGKKEPKNAMPDKTCPVCQMHFADFRKTSRLGCQACYDAFEEELTPLIEGMQKGKKHIGKFPKAFAEKPSATRDLSALRNALQEAVAMEDYEAAARIRDRIRGHADAANQPAG